MRIARKAGRGIIVKIKGKKDDFNSRIIRTLHTIDELSPDEKRGWTEQVIASIDRSELPKGEDEDLTDILRCPLLRSAYESLFPENN